MLRKISIIPIWLAMLMVAFTTVVPHHHHGAMICIVKEICSVDGCCDDEHTQHHDADQGEEESHCIAHEQYVLSENLRLDKPLCSNQIVIPDVTACLADLESIQETVVLTIDGSLDSASFMVPSAPPLSSAAPNAPPVSFIA